MTQHVAKIWVCFAWTKEKKNSVIIQEKKEMDEESQNSKRMLLLECVLLPQSA